MNAFEKQDTIKIIEKKVAEIWHSDRYPYDPDDIIVELVESNNEGCVDITISAEYNAPNLTFEKLVKLSEFFGGTQRIDTISEIDKEGCETCDYGSCYGYTLRVMPPTKNDKPLKDRFSWMQLEAK